MRRSNLYSDRVFLSLTASDSDIAKVHPIMMISKRVYSSLIQKKKIFKCSLSFDHQQNILDRESRRVGIGPSRRGVALRVGLVVTSLSLVTLTGAGDTRWAVAAVSSELAPGLRVVGQFRLFSHGYGQVNVASRRGGLTRSLSQVDSSLCERARRRQPQCGTGHL